MSDSESGSVAERREASAADVPVATAAGPPPRLTRLRADRFYREFGPAVYRRCLRLLRDREAAQDATQEVFVRLLRAPEKLLDARTALPWAYRVATNHCLNLRRDSRSKREDELSAELPERDGGGRRGYPELQLARDVLSRFDAQTQAVAVGVFVEGMEHDEVAALLGISRRTVSRKIEKFMEHARKYISRTDSE